MKADKIQGDLSHRLAEARRGTSVEAVIQVAVPTKTESLKRQRRIQEYRRAIIEESLGPMVLRIRDLGGDVLDQAWINATLRVKLPVESFGPLTDEAAVTRVDLPSRLKPESGG